jgi:hypothetical protein
VPLTRLLGTSITRRPPTMPTLELMPTGLEARVASTLPAPSTELEPSVSSALTTMEVGLPRLLLALADLKASLIPSPFLLHSNLVRSGAENSNAVNTSDARSDINHGNDVHGKTSPSNGGTFGVSPTHKNAHTGKEGVQPVHNSQIMNTADPRVDSDRTTASHSSSSATRASAATGLNGEKHSHHGGPSSSSSALPRPSLLPEFGPVANSSALPSFRLTVEPVHSSQTANVVDPRVDSSRTYNATNDLESAARR